MKILLIYPEYPETFWSFKYALKFVLKKAAHPPLGLLTVAAMLPSGWNKKLIDMNVEKLRDRDILWADYIFISAMVVQGNSAADVIKRCKSLGRKVVAGGPLFTASHEDFPEVDHFVLNEAEITLPMFLSDLKDGSLKRMYKTGELADVFKTPVPDYGLAKIKHYASMNIQYSRGCPYDCEFCNVTVLFGRKPRTKTKEQVIAELDHLYSLGWRGAVFFVDDNFIGNKVKLKREILPAIIDWTKRKKHPFSFFTEVSINLSDDEELMQMMVRAGFDCVFVGIESPNEESLTECMKIPNRNRDLIESVKKLQRAGLEVQGGFIVGFDKDPESIFDRMIKFIQESGIVTAMVGLLNAPRGTKLYRRLKEEGRLLYSMSGDNTDFSMNFKPKMHYEKLLSGYAKIVKTIYSPKNYYARIKQFMKEFKPTQPKMFHFKLEHFNAIFRTTLVMGILGKGRFHYWRLFFWSLVRKPRLLPLMITLCIYGFHFRKVFKNNAMSTR